MKKLTLLSTLFFLLLALAVKAQIPPNAFNYTAVARERGQPIANASIGIQISILKTSITGPPHYIENHVANTDAYGLFNIVVGAGAVQSGLMDSIDWSNDRYYLKVDMDTLGGTNFLTLGTTQLLSVPYAMYAKSAGTVSSGDTIGNFTHFIGEEFGGGVIFHLWKDAQGLEHGLIIDKIELSTGQFWSNIVDQTVGPSAQSYWDGLSNSDAIVGQAGHLSSAAELCLNSTNGGQSDWYLPAIDELEKLYQNRLEVNASLRTIAGATELKRVDNNGNSLYYWSSTQISINSAGTFGFDTPYWSNFYAIGGVKYIDKSGLFLVRAVRAF